MALCLEPCPSCSRHVRADAQACPFCSATLPDSFRERPAPVPPQAGLSRGQLGAYRATGFVSIAAYALASATILADCGSASAAYGGTPVPGMPLTSPTPSFLPESCTSRTYYEVNRWDGECDGGPVFFVCYYGGWETYACELPSGYSEATGDDLMASGTSTTTTATTTGSGTSCTGTSRFTTTTTTTTPTSAAEPGSSERGSSR